MTNIVIGYTGNVCSTPMVEYARSIDGVWVPIQEQFDEYQLIKRWPNQKRISLELADTLAALYQRRTTAYLETPFLLEYRGNGPIPSRQEKPDVVFKWRPRSRRAPGRNRLRKVFTENDVRPAIILRRSLSAQALKVFLSEKVYQSRHQQFSVAKLSEQDYASFINEQMKISVNLSDENIVQVAKIAKNFLSRTRAMFGDMSYYFPATKPIPAIIAEDIFSPVIEVARYEEVLSQLLDRPIQLPKRSRPSVRKGGLNIENCANFEKVLSNRRLVRLERKYTRLLSKTRVISDSHVHLHATTANLAEQRSADYSGSNTERHEGKSTLPTSGLPAFQHDEGRAA